MLLVKTKLVTQINGKFIKKSNRDLKKLIIKAKRESWTSFINSIELPAFKLPKLNGTSLTLSTQAKFLGIILDRKLNWNLNIDERL